MRINSEAEKVKDELADRRDETNLEVLRIFYALALAPEEQNIYRKKKPMLTFVRVK